MGFLEELLRGLLSQGPWVFMGYLVVLGALSYAYRQIRRRRKVAALARPFGLRPLVAEPSLLGLLRYSPGLTGTFHGQAVRLTVEHARTNGESSTFRVTTILRLRVEPFLSADLAAERHRGMSRLMRALGVRDVTLDGTALERLSDLYALGPRDRAVLRLPQVDAALAALLNAADDWRFVRGDLQLRKHSSSFGMLKVAETLLTRAREVAVVLSSPEVAEVLQDVPERTSVWSA